jgi:integrase/recombinase XerD
MTEKFIQERKYLKAVSEKTLLWYKDSFRAFEGALDSTETINARVVELRMRCVKPVSVNTWLRCIKAYYLWQGKEWKVSRLKEEQKILTVLSPEGVRALIGYKPKGFNQTRAHTIALTILDTGLRASEVLGLTTGDVDLENFVMKIAGKGGKHRLVPFSAELRKTLYRYMSKNHMPLVFGTTTRAKVSVCNLERDFNFIGKKIGYKLAPHNLRHCFAVNYLKNGGNLEYLRRILGHSSLTTTQKYLRALGVEDLQKVHDSLSLLSR